MWSDDSRSVPDWIEEAYEIVVAHAEESDEPLTRERAHETLLGHGDFPEETADAEYAIEQLLNYGWFYEVEGELRITDPEG